jgi:hypothetical protein
MKRKNILLIIGTILITGYFINVKAESIDSFFNDAEKDFFITKIYPGVTKGMDVYNYIINNYKTEEYLINENFSENRKQYIINLKMIKMPEIDETVYIKNQFHIICEKNTDIIKSVLNFEELIFPIISEPNENKIIQTIFAIKLLEAYKKQFSEPDAIFKNNIFGYTYKWYINENYKFLISFNTEKYIWTYALTNE